jgi:hypothetical protein
MFGFALRFVVAVLATWRVTHLLAAEDGPADVIVRFRGLLGRSIFGTLMDCFNCLSIWIAAAAALYVTRRWLEWVMVWLAISGAACLLERRSERPELIEPAYLHSQGESDHVLRTEANGSQEQSFESEPGSCSPAGSTGLEPDSNAERFGFSASRTGS